MKAAILEENSKKLVIKELARPECLEKEVLVKIKACGVCHTDLHYIDHGVKTYKGLPIIPGHEAAGIIEEAGLEVKNFSKGDRVIIPAVLSCGNCKLCKQGRGNICLNMEMVGNHINGAFAEYICVKAKDLVALPDSLSFEEGALIADALSTAYHAVINRAKVNKDNTAVIVGYGGIGSSILQVLKALEARIIVIDIEKEKLDYAKNSGADLTVLSTDEKLIKKIKEKFPDPIDFVFDSAGTAESYELSAKISGCGTIMLQVGFNKSKTNVNLAKLMFLEQGIIGTVGCPPQDYYKVIDFILTKKLNLKDIISFSYKLEDINLALDNLRNSRGLRSIISFD